MLWNIFNITVCPASSFNEQKIEIFEGSGFKNDKVCREAGEIRLKIEDYWLKILRSTFLYNMNERTRTNDMEHNTPAGKLFPVIFRSIARSKWCWGNIVKVQKLCFSTYVETVEIV